MTVVPVKSRSTLPQGLIQTLIVLMDAFFFLIAGASSVWLVWILISDNRKNQWLLALFVVLLWAVLAYLFLPRLHRLLTTIYVPNYFIGRSKTTDGLLGDPVNLAFNGPEENIHRAMQAAGWTLASPVNLVSAWKIVVATLTGRSYKEAPVSTLKLFGKMQSFAYQMEVSGSPKKRHHIRFWRCPDDWPLPGGNRRVQWMAAASYDRAVGLSLFTLQITHKISSDIDGERDHVVQTLKNIDEDLNVEILEDFSTAYHSVNGGGDEVSTDGDLPIIDLEYLPSHLPEPNFAAIRRNADEPDPKASDILQQQAKIPRPIGVYWAAFLILLEVLISIWWIATVNSHWAQSAVEIQTQATNEGLNPDEYLELLVIANAILIGARILLGIGMWLGYNGARTMQMVLATFSIGTSFVGWLRFGESITWQTTLVPVAVSILLLLALTSEQVDDFVAATQSWRRHRKRLKRKVTKA